MHFIKESQNYLIYYSLEPKREIQEGFFQKHDILSRLKNIKRTMKKKKT